MVCYANDSLKMTLIVCLMIGTSVSPNLAMDLIYEVITGWTRLFQEVLTFKEVLSSHLSPCMKPYLRNLRDDYIGLLKSGGSGPANAQISLVSRIARSLLLHFLTVRGFLLEVEMLVNLMMHSILPEKVGIGAMSGSSSDIPRQIISIEDGNKLRYDDGSVQIVGLGSGVAGALAGGLMRLAITAQGGIKSAAGGNGAAASGGSSTSAASTRGSGIAGCGFMALCTNPRSNEAGKLGQIGTVPDSSPMASSYSAYSSSNTQIDLVYVPSFPIAVCLETVISLFLSDRATDVMAMGLGGVDAVKTIYTCVIYTVSTLLHQAFAVESNVRYDFPANLKYVLTV